MRITDIILALGLAGAAAVAAFDSEPRSSTTNRDTASPSDRSSRDATSAGDVYYAGCNEVRALGKDPLYRGQPGYRIGMDGDRDGIACEPHRGKGRRR